MATNVRCVGRRGAHALEFALLMPVFIGIWLGIVEYCWLAYQYTSVNEAVAVGCRAGSLMDPGVDEVNAPSVIEETKKGILEAMDVRGAGCSGGCTPNVSLVNARPNRSLACGMTVEYGSITGFVPTPTSLSSDAVVRMEYQRGGT